MLGYALHRVLHDAKFDVIGSVKEEVPSRFLSPRLKHLEHVNILDDASVSRTLTEVNPDVVINSTCNKDNQNLNDLMWVNSVFPKRLEWMASNRGMRLIHFSTDGVFDGIQGAPYNEEDLPNCQDPYGVTKLLGEVVGEGCYTFRLSLIGLTGKPNGSLLDWFLSQHGSVKGFSKYRFSGLPANEVAKFVSALLLRPMDSLPFGIYHLASAPLSKLSLLKQVGQVWNRPDLKLVEDDSVVINRTLDGTRLNRLVSFEAPNWLEMLEGMKVFYDGSGVLK
mgnify:CR=1 FL=1